MLCVRLLSLRPFLRRQRPIRRQVVTVYQHHAQASPLLEMDCGHLAEVPTLREVREHHECRDCRSSEAMRQLLAEYLPARA